MVVESTDVQPICVGIVVGSWISFGVRVSRLDAHWLPRRITRCPRQLRLGAVCFYGGGMTTGQHAATTLFNMFNIMATHLKVGLPFRELNVRLFRTGLKQAPKLKLKAAAGRYFLPVLVATMEHMVDCTSEHAMMRLSCMTALEQCYNEFKNWGPASPAQLATHCRQFLQLYSALSRASLGSRL